VPTFIGASIKFIVIYGINVWHIFYYWDYWKRCSSDFL